MGKRPELRTAPKQAKVPVRQAQTAARRAPRRPGARAPHGADDVSLRTVVRQTARLWQRAHLSYDMAVEVGKRVRAELELRRPGKRVHVVDRLTATEERQLVDRAYATDGTRGLLVKTLLHTGARVSEFVNIRVEDFSVDEATIRIRHGKGGKERVVPLLRPDAQELRTHLGDRRGGHLFEARGAHRFTTRRVQQILHEVATSAKIAKRVYPHLLRHTVAQRLLEGGVSLEQVQQFLGHAQLATTQIYARSTPHMIREAFERALTSR